jgi:hypothetical protein
MGPLGPVPSENTERPDWKQGKDAASSSKSRHDTVFLDLDERHLTGPACRKRFALSMLI